MTVRAAAPEGAAAASPAEAGAHTEARAPEEPAPTVQQDGGAALKKKGNDLVVMGLSVGAIGVVGAAIGAVCPVCVVATPALLGAGAVRHWQARRRKAREGNGASIDSTDPARR